VEFVLASKLQSILSDFDRDRFSIWLWQGRVVMHNLRLSPEICAGLGLPLQLCWGKIDSLDLVVPWRALATEAVEVRVEGVVIVLRTVEKEGWGGGKEGILAEMREKVEFEDGRLRIKEGKSETSYGSLTEKIIRNLRFEVRNVHIRLESEDCQCSLGLVSELITCTAPTGSAAGFNKAVSVGVVYFYAESGEVVAGNTGKEEEMEELTCRFLCGEESESVICPLSLEAELSSQGENSHYSLKITVPRLDLHLSQTQYQCLSRVMEAGGHFTAFQKAQKEQLIAEYRDYLEDNPCPIDHKITFKSARNRLKSSPFPSDSEAQYRYDAIIATTPEEELFAWLLELNGEIALQPKRLAWVTSWFTGNRAMDPLPEPQSADREFETSTVEIELVIERIKATMQGRRTTCSEYIYRVEVDVEGVGGLLVQQAQHRRVALHLRSLEVRFQDPISLSRFPLFRFTDEGSAEEQLFLTLNQHSSIPPKTTISLELESFRLLFSLSILAQLQSFFSTSASSPVPPSQPILVQLQTLWRSLDLDLHVKPWDLVLLADETKPSLHLIMSVGDAALVKIANVAREEEAIKMTNEKVEMTVIGCNLVLVSPLLSQIPLFSLSQRINIELLVDKDDFSSLAVTADLPKTQIHLSNSTFSQLKSFFSLLYTSSSEISHLDTRKKAILSHFHPNKHFGLLYRHFQQAWHSYFTVLTQGYLYFFTTPEDKEASLYFAVGDCEVRDPVTERLLQGQDAFEPFEEVPPYQVIVVSRSGERSCRLGFETAEKCKAWVSQLVRTPPKVPPPSEKPFSLPFPSLQVRLHLPLFHFTLDLEPSKPLSITLIDAEIASKVAGTLCELVFGGKVGVGVGTGEGPRRFRELILPVSPIKLQALYEFSGKRELEVRLESEKVELNWNHGTIASLLKATSLQESQTNTANGKSMPLSLLIDIKALHLTLNNEPTLFTFCELDLKDLHFTQNPSETVLSLSSLSLFDVSNYPESSNLSETQSPRRLPLLQTTSKRPISLSILQSHLTASISHIEIVYLQQPFLRVLNTFLHHIPSVLFA